MVWFQLCVCVVSSFSLVHLTNLCTSFYLFIFFVSYYWVFVAVGFEWLWWIEMWTLSDWIHKNDEIWIIMWERIYNHYIKIISVKYFVWKPNWIEGIVKCFHIVYLCVAPIIILEQCNHYSESKSSISMVQSKSYLWYRCILFLVIIQLYTWNIMRFDWFYFLSLFFNSNVVWIFRLIWCDFWQLRSTDYWIPTNENQKST